MNVAEIANLFDLTEEVNEDEHVFRVFPSFVFHKAVRLVRL